MGLRAPLLLRNLHTHSHTSFSVFSGFCVLLPIFITWANRGADGERKGRKVLLLRLSVLFAVMIGGRCSTQWTRLPFVKQFFFMFI
jgi:hypothetical protein